MIDHPSEALLRRFADGELDESLAVELALHLDDCPRCSTQVHAMDELASAYASMDDPMVPEDLVHQVLEATMDLPLETPSAEPGWLEGLGGFRVPTRELLASLGLLSTAGLVLLILGDPADLATEAALTASAVVTAGDIVLGELAGASWMLMPFAAVGFLVSLLLATGFGQRPLPFSQGPRDW
jgi:anti-sigma factor RsiW